MTQNAVPTEWAWGGRGSTWSDSWWWSLWAPSAEDSARFSSAAVASPVALIPQQMSPPRSHVTGSTDHLRTQETRMSTVPPPPDESLQLDADGLPVAPDPFAVLGRLSAILLMTPDWRSDAETLALAREYLTAWRTPFDARAAARRARLRRVDIPPLDDPPGAPGPV